MLPVNLMGDAAAAEAMVVQATKPSHSGSSAQANRFNSELEILRDTSRLSVTPLSPVYTHNPVRSHEDRSKVFWRRNRDSDRNHSKQQTREESKQEAYQPLLFEMKTDRVADEYQHGRHAESLGELVDMRI